MTYAEFTIENDWLDLVRGSVWLVVGMQAVGDTAILTLNLSLGSPFDKGLCLK